MTTEPILDLAADQVPRPWIRDAEGNHHELATIDDLGINARRKLVRAWERVNRITAKDDDLTPEEEREYDAIYRELATLILPSLSEEQIEALGQERREAVASAFFTYRTAPLLMERLISQLSLAVAVQSGTSSSPSSSTTTDEPPSPEATGETSP